jgi:hypothetical protein
MSNFAAFVPAIQTSRTMRMVRFLVPLLIAAPFCAFAVAGQAQDDSILSPVIPSIAAPAKPRPANSAHSNAAAHRSAKPDSEEADKAARLAEGRKKFFDRSMGFDNGESSRITITNDGGGSPAVGLKF